MVKKIAVLFFIFAVGHAFAMDGEGSELSQKKKKGMKSLWEIFEKTDQECNDKNRQDDAHFEKMVYLTANGLRSKKQYDSAIIFYKILIGDDECPQALRARSAYDLACIYIAKKEKSVSLGWLEMSANTFGYNEAQRKLKPYQKAGCHVAKIKNDQEETAKYVFSFREVLDRTFPDLEKLD